jgi:methyltransferase family protein
MKPKDRIELAKMFAELGYKKGAEIGVCTGRYSRILLDTIPDLQLLGVDPYRPYAGYTDFRRQSTHNSNLALAREATGEFPNYTLMLAFGTEAAKWIADGSLDFVFLDGNHQYESVKQDIADWAPKVRKGGVISGHDYYEFRSGNGGVVQAVDEYAQEHGYEVNSTGWTKGAHHDDKQPDWWFFKQ